MFSLCVVVLKTLDDYNILYIFTLNVRSDNGHVMFYYMTINEQLCIILNALFIFSKSFSKLFNMKKFETITIYYIRTAVLWACSKCTTNRMTTWAFVTLSLSPAILLVLPLKVPWPGTCILLSCVQQINVPKGKTNHLMKNGPNGAPLCSLKLGSHYQIR